MGWLDFPHEVLEPPIIGEPTEDTLPAAQRSFKVLAKNSIKFKFGCQRERRKGGRWENNANSNRNTASPEIAPGHMSPANTVQAHNTQEGMQVNVQQWLLETLSLFMQTFLAIALCGNLLHSSKRLRLALKSHPQLQYLFHYAVL